MQAAKEKSKVLLPHNLHGYSLTQLHSVVAAQNHLASDAND